jgi:hypothetical protein
MGNEESLAIEVPIEGPSVFTKLNKLTLSK